MKFGRTLESLDFDNSLIVICDISHGQQIFVSMVPVLANLDGGFASFNLCSRSCSSRGLSDML